MLYDKDIREPLFEYLDETFGRIRIIEEKNMGRSRADVVMVTPQALVGIEIKSDADTYVRLSHQIKDYDALFDYNMIAVGSTHAAHIREHVPEHWGIITIDEIDHQPDFYMYRAMQPAGTSKIKLKRQLNMLWREELMHIQLRAGMYAYRSKSKKFVREKILEKVPEELLKQWIREELFERDYSLLDNDRS